MKAEMRMRLSNHDGHWFQGTGRNGYYHNGRFTVEICSSYLYRWLDVPRDVKQIFAVFTTKPDPDAHCYKIAKPVKRLHWLGEGLNETSLVNFRGSLMTGTQQKLGEMYNRGFRYVHIEWNE
jgi:hypothetical protein